MYIDLPATIKKIKTYIHTFYYISTNKTYVNPKKSFFNMLTNKVLFGEACDTLHVDLFNSICERSNNKK